MTELRFDFGNDPAWMAIIDVSRYEADLADWNYDTLTEKVLGAMQAEQLVAWGTPERPLRLAITRRRPATPAVASTSATLHVTGPLAVASYTAVTMAAQFAAVQVLDEAEYRFDLNEGRYRVEILRFFDHVAGEQDSARPTDPRQEDYVVVFDPAPSLTETLTAVAWTSASI